MPRIKRWFAVSHDINEDAEVWELTRAHGDRALRVWLEILSIADRNEGVIPGALESVVRALSGKCQAAPRTVRGVVSHAWNHGWLVPSEVPLRVRNYLKYHPSRDTKRELNSNFLASPPILPYTTLTKEKEKKEKEMSVLPQNGAARTRLASDAAGPFRAPAAPP